MSSSSDEHPQQQQQQQQQHPPRHHSSNDSSKVLHGIIEEQLTSLDDSDDHASAWAQVLASSTSLSWGGRGRGGRGLARRTVQPHDIVVEEVHLEYVNDAVQSNVTKVLLDGSSQTRLKLLCARVYALVGRNGCGKSTLLRRMQSKKVPGFPRHLTSMYIPQEVFDTDVDAGGVVDDDDKDDAPNVGSSLLSTPLDVAKAQWEMMTSQSHDVNRMHIEALEREIESLDLTNDDDHNDNCDTHVTSTEKMELLCEKISAIEEDQESVDDDDSFRTKITSAFRFFCIPSELWDVPFARLSGGLRKKVVLACALIGDPDLLMLDEPTDHMDFDGILQLRRLIQHCLQKKTTVVLVSHDVDLVNDLATDVIHFHNRTLTYYPGNYRDFLKLRQQQHLHIVRQQNTLDRQRKSMLKSIDNMKSQCSKASSSGKGDFNPRANRKLKKAINVKKKKLEKHGIQQDANGHRWTSQNMGTGIKEGSINSIPVSERKKLSAAQLLKKPETSILPEPDKAVQFVFRNSTCTWGEPLIMAMDVGFGFETKVDDTKSGTDPVDNRETTATSSLLFDCVDLCVEEGSRTFILGANGSGKSTLLKLLAKTISPVEGTIHHAHNLSVAFFHQHLADDLIQVAEQHSSSSSSSAKKTNARAAPSSLTLTPLSLLQRLNPQKSEQDLRGELTSFGLDPLVQTGSNIKFLSGGERVRLCFAMIMLNENPNVLIIDEPTNHLDVEGVEALIYAIRRWNGTVIMVSHDANFVRSVGGECYVLMEQPQQRQRQDEHQTKGKLVRIVGGVDAYIRHVGAQARHG